MNTQACSIRIYNNVFACCRFSLCCTLSMIKNLPDFEECS